jgi:hypothetical protein
MASREITFFRMEYERNKRMMQWDETVFFNQINE